MILINGTSAAEYGITFEAGTLEELYKIPPLKGYASFGSRHIDGRKISAAGRKVDAQEVQLPFILRGTTRADYLAKLAALTELLRVGKDMTGITELTYDGKTWKLIYIDSDPIRFINATTSKFLVTFEEPNPNDR